MNLRDRNDVFSYRTIKAQDRTRVNKTKFTYYRNVFMFFVCIYIYVGVCVFVCVCTCKEDNRQPGSTGLLPSIERVVVDYVLPCPQKHTYTQTTHTL